MVPVADTCVYAEGLELTNTEWRSMLGCLMIPNRGFQPPFLHRLTTADLQESWKLPSIVKFPAPSSGKVTLETVHKNGYGDMQADYHIDSEECINITTGWKEFVSQNGFEVGEVAMLFFYKEEDSLKFTIFAL
ncbi:hypothetical protein VPH35_037067 [Triticum aestivum]